MNVARMNFREATEMEYRKPHGSFIPAAWIVRPPWSSGRPPVISIHGISREAELMADLMMPIAMQSGRTLVVPHFDQDHFPRYQKSICRNRSDLALIRLVEGLREEGILPASNFDLAGFSGGAQFAHRFCWFYPHLVGRLIVSSAGWYTFPDEAPFPYGAGAGNYRNIKTGLCLKTNLQSFLDREIVVRVGERDDIVDKMTRSGAAIDAQQGKDRKARARNWTAALKQSAMRLGVVPHIDFAELPDCGHDFEECCSRGGLDRLILNEMTADGDQAHG